jgi:hypothetical protein
VSDNNWRDTPQRPMTTDELIECIVKLKSELAQVKDLLEITKEQSRIRAENLSPLKMEISKLKAELKQERDVVDFYANEKHWDDHYLLRLTDRETTNYHASCGGKRARIRQSERKNI